jgi:cytochrome b pre-mRNA-processing protein 3
MAIKEKGAATGFAGRKLRATVAPPAIACQRSVRQKIGLAWVVSRPRAICRLKDSLVLFGSRSIRRAAGELYTRAVAAARIPHFYSAFAVPDTIEGRYEMIVLHIVLVLRRLRQPGEHRKQLAQALVDYMAADFDRSIRELGVGDLSVGKFMKRLGEGLFGRAAAYDKALDTGDRLALQAALLRNIYDDAMSCDGDGPDDRILAAFAAYVEDQHAHLSAQPIGPISDGIVDFLTPGIES